MESSAISGELDDYIARGRATVTIAGAEPVFVKRGTSAFLILHGWCATAESVRFLTAGIAGGGYSVLAPTLPGHGTTAQDMISRGPADWIHAARHAFQLLGRHFNAVHVAGVSMGGALALQLAALEPDQVASVTTVNAPIFLANPRLAVEVMQGPPETSLTSWNAPSFVGPPVPEIIYEERSHKSGMDLITMAALARETLPAIRAPLLAIQSRRDPIVPPSCAEEILAVAGSAVKKRVWLDNSFHTSQLDVDHKQIVATTLEFARTLNQLG